VLNPGHDIHLIFHLLVDNSISHEFRLVQFLRRIRETVELGRYFIHGSKCTLSDLAHAVVLAGTTPRQRELIQEGNWSYFGGIVGLLGCRPSSYRRLLNGCFEDIHLVGDVSSVLVWDSTILTCPPGPGTMVLLTLSNSTVCLSMYACSLRR